MVLAGWVGFGFLSVFEEIYFEVVKRFYTHSIKGENDKKEI